MDGLVVILGIVGLTLLAMPVLLVVALSSLSGLKARVAELERALADLRMAAWRAAPGGEAAAMAAAAARGPGNVRASADGSSAGVSSGDASSDAPSGEGAPTLAELMRRQAASGAAPPPVPSPPLRETVAPAASRSSVPVAPATPVASEQASTGGSTGVIPPALPPPLTTLRPSVTPDGRARNVDAPFGALARAVKRWFTVGNVPVKIGVLVLLAGVAALLKYASDRGLFSVPLELRLAGVAAVALAALGFAWTRRESNRVFALSLQGGAIGVLLLTVYAAFKLYGLLPAGAAFALSIVLVAGMGLLAVLQDARALAVFALLAGFLAPLWLSTGRGDHVALFSYYAVLDAAIVAIAWFRAWRILNLLGFAFTFGIGALWGAGSYRPELYASTQPFLLLFFAFYLAVPILFARRQPPGRRDLVDGCLVFGTPLVAFALQARLLQGVAADADRLPLALCALGLGVLYAGLAWALRRRDDYRVLRDAYAILAVGFATLAVPLALSARATASVFALEGAGLVWLGLRQGRRLPQFAGTALQGLAGIASFIGLEAAHGDARMLLNPTAMGALLVALAGFASAWAQRAHAVASSTLRVHADAGGSIQGGNGRALAFYLWGLAWWIGTGVHEVHRFIDAPARPDALLAFAALSGWLAAEVQRRRPARALVLSVFAAFVVAMPLALWQDAVHAHPFGGDWGVPAWLAFAVLGLRSLGCLHDDASRGADAAQFAWWLLWPLVLSLAAHWLAVQAGLAEGWYLALVALPWLVLAALASWCWSWLAFPRGDVAGADLHATLSLVASSLLAVGWLLALPHAASPAPLPWLPLLNPAELAQLLALGLLAAWLWSGRAPAELARLRPGLLASGGFLLLSASTLRSVHHWGGIAWNASLPSSSLAQTSLTVVWSVLGVAAWIAGSRRGRRGLWLAGAVLMAVVLAKLLLVDRRHLGGVLGIVSFIAYGVLCMIVGYLAPAPPRTDAVAQEEPQP